VIFTKRSPVPYPLMRKSLTFDPNVLPLGVPAGILRATAR